MDAPLSATLQFSTPVLNTVSSWPAQQVEIHKKLKKQQKSQERDLQKMEAKITRIRDQWEPRLDELIGKINDAFSYNFAQISCAGEVGVNKDEDFDKWAIEIKVKFR